MAVPSSNLRHPLIGRVLENRYQVASLIREGGMAQVFCASQEANPRHVAVKVVHPHLASMPEVVSRFMREARVASSLSHDNIVKIFSFGKEGNVLYIVMELLFGDDLSARIRGRGVPPLRATEIMIEVCQALAHAHAKGVVHRDIKPENVMLSRSPSAPGKEVVKVLDFGIAKVLDNQPTVDSGEDAVTGARSVLTRVGSWVGTPAYMSPEQGRGEPIDHRSDIYSAGVLLYELICGRPPFEGKTAFQVMAAHAQEIPLPPSLITQVPLELERVILAALEKKPANRPQTAAALEALLRGVLPDLDPGSSERWVDKTRYGRARASAAGVPGQERVPAQDRDAVTRVVGQASPTTLPSKDTGGAPSKPERKTVTIDLGDPIEGESEVRAPKPSHPLIGRVLEGRYRVLSFIQQGAMAQVFCGVDETTSEHVAIKVIHPEFSADRDMCMRFKREGKLAAKLTHANTVRVLATGQDGEVLYMVMELLFGDSLAARVREWGRLSQPEVVDIGGQICRALEHAHSLGIVHRDIKPENIMLCRLPSAPENEVVKVLDFGIAKSLVSEKAVPSKPPSSDEITGIDSALTRVGALVGTPAYMSPEQGRAEPTDERSDIYSVGVLLYELLCGQPPFDGESVLHIISRHVNEEPKRPSSIAPIPLALEDIVLRALAKHPKDRHQTAAELAWELEAISSELDAPVSSATNEWVAAVSQIERQVLADAAGKNRDQSTRVEGVSEADERASEPPVAERAPVSTEQPKIEVIPVAPRSAATRAAPPNRRLQQRVGDDTVEVEPEPELHTRVSRTNIKAYRPAAVAVEVVAPPPSEREDADISDDDLATEVQPHLMLDQLANAKGEALAAPAEVTREPSPPRSEGAAATPSSKREAVPSEAPGSQPVAARDPRVDDLIRMVRLLAILLVLAIAALGITLFVVLRR
ncbi:MAG: serine/threonine-protein kinase [Polyangiaceae bacterium]